MFLTPLCVTGEEVSTEKGPRSSQREGEPDSGPAGFLAHMTERNCSPRQSEAHRGRSRKADTPRGRTRPP